MQDNVLEVRNLTKKFRNFTAVDNISFSLKKGEILGLLGPNGAGKTTTIQMLLGVMQQTKGEIFYFGQPFEKNKNQILKRINFCSTYISLPWLFTVNETLGIFARLYEIENKEKRISKLLKEFDIEHLARKQFYKLSSGEKTRVLLTKAFLNYPKVILLDEPTSSLDPDIAVKVREFLKKQRKEYGVSMLLTSHNMSETEEICDRIVILNKGKIIEEDSPGNLVKKIEKTKLELMIEKDTKKAVVFFAKSKISFEQDRFNFRITIDEKKIAEFLTLLSKERIQFENINIERANLEDYFLQVIKKKKYD